MADTAFEARLIQTADPADLAAAHKAYFAPTPERPWTIGDYIGLLGDPNTYIWRACLGGRSVGLAVCQLVEEEAELLTFAIAPEETGAGLGRQFLDRVMDDLRARGVHKLYLDVRIDNYHAYNLYNSVGAEFNSIRKQYYTLKDGTRLDAHCLSIFL